MRLGGLLCRPHNLVRPHYCPPQVCPHQWAPQSADMPGLLGFLEGGQRVPYGTPA
jgi:hypothetical protein